MSGSTRPIFIVGCQRSGTTLLRMMVDTHPNIACGPETRFLRELETITGTHWNRISRYGFPKEYWDNRIAEFFGGFHADYAASKGKGRWADKSPLYALHLPFIIELFPDAQIIHVIRDVRDVTISHRDAFGYRAALKAPSKWTRYIKEVRRVAATLPPEQYHELRYESLIADTEGTLKELVTFLGEDWDPVMLDYQSKPHDATDKHAIRSAKRRAQAGTQSSVYRSRVGAHSRQRDPLLRLATRYYARPMMRELGYA